MSDYEKLLLTLQKELAYQQQILSLISREQIAIVKLNQEELDQCCREKENLVEEARNLEKQRHAAIDRIALREAGERSPAPKFLELLARCPDRQLKKQLAAIGEELKTVASRVRKLNEGNGGLIKNCLGLIGSTIAIMRSHPGAELPTYSQNGKLKSQSQDPAFTDARSGITRAA